WNIARSRSTVARSVSIAMAIAFFPSRRSAGQRPRCHPEESILSRLSSRPNARRRDDLAEDLRASGAAAAVSDNKAHDASIVGFVTFRGAVSGWTRRVRNLPSESQVRLFGSP